MARCRGCGSNGEGNFCDQCGLPRRDGAEGPLILGAEPSEAAPASVRVSRGSSRLTAVLGIALAALLGLGIFASVRSPEPVDRGFAVDEEGDEQDRDDSGDDDVGFNTTTTAPEPPSTPPTTASLGGELLLDAEYGWDVIAATDESLVRVDSSTGEVVPLGVKASPVGYVNDMIALQDAEHRIILVDPIVLSGAAPVQLPDPIGDSPLAADGVVALMPSLNPETFWLITDFGSWVTEVRISDGTVLRTITTEGSYESLVLSPDFRTPLPGGVYRLTSDSDFTRVADGRVLVRVRDAVLVQTCDQTLECVNTWRDVLTMEPRTDLLAPKYTDNSFYFPFAGAAFIFNGETLVDLETGVSRRFPADMMNNFFDGTGDLSPDGQVFVSSEGTRLRFRGAAAATVSLGGDVITMYRPVFVPKPAPTP